jgi:protein involved in polysaccharide export with SLBB domain
MQGGQRNRNKWLAAVIFAAALLTVIGCAPTYRNYGAFLQQPRPQVTAAEYRMAPPDVLRVRSRRVREIDGWIEMIRPDGKISLPLVGSVEATGKTCEELAGELRELAGAYYQDADITVTITDYNSKKVYVFGEVSNPGPYTYNGRNTLLRLMAHAQPTRLSDPGKIQIMRPGADGEAERLTVNLNKMIQKGDLRMDAPLKEGDIVYVPANPLAAVGLAFQQVLMPVRPIAETVRGPADIDGAAGAYGPNRSRSE